MRKNIKELLTSMGFKIIGETVAVHKDFGMINCPEKITVEDVAQKIFNAGQRAKSEEIKKVLYIHHK